MLTDWIGPLGQLRKLSFRHLHPTFEGDMIRYSGKVVENPLARMLLGSPAIWKEKTRTIVRSLPDAAR